MKSQYVRDEKCENIHSNERSDQPSDTLTDEMRRAVFTILKHDRRFTICEIWNLLVDKHSIEVSHMTVQRDTHVCVRWVLKPSTDENKQMGVDTDQKFLVQHTNGPIMMIMHIITADKLWIIYITPTQKEDTQVWHKKGESAPKNFVLTVQ